MTFKFHIASDVSNFITQIMLPSLLYTCKRLRATILYTECPTIYRKSVLHLYLSIGSKFAVNFETLSNYHGKPRAGPRANGKTKFRLLLV